MTQAEPIAGALARAASLRERGAHPLALLDLDLTLIDNGPRTRAILDAWLAGLGAPTPSDRPPPASAPRLAPSQTTGIDEARARVASMPLRFSIRDNLVACLATTALDGHPGLLEDGFRFWRRAFFDPRWLVHDVALDGAVDAVRALIAADVTVVYVTARKGDLAAGTVASLYALGFPIAGPRALLVTNTDPALSDHASKIEALAFCARLGEVVLCAENEPAHANAMHERFPDALTVLVETRHSEPAPPLHPGIARAPRLIDIL